MLVAVKKKTDMTETNHYYISDEPIADPGGYLAGHLLSALEMEDKVSGDVYNEYENRSTWPAELPEEVFVNIQKMLRILINQTDQHKSAFRALQKNIS